ncbi:MAG: type II secretion system protein [Betaproteobacteria bacterium]
MSTRSRGVTLVELIVFIVIVGVALAGLFAAFNTITAASADPQVRKQVLAIAESLMDEIMLKPFTYCDPDDANAATAADSTGCAVAANREDVTIGPEAGETRTSTTTPFDNVSDYHGFAMGPGIDDSTGTTIAGLGAYSASVAVTRAGTSLGLPLDDDALRISITVTGPGSVSTTLDGYRARYAPNTLP